VVRVYPFISFIKGLKRVIYRLISDSVRSSSGPLLFTNSSNLPASRLGMSGPRNHAHTLPLNEAGIPDSVASFRIFLGAPSAGIGEETIVN
jgi:hypothetical protein